MTKKENLLNFGKRLRTLRKERKFTQAKLAEKIDVSPNFIGMVERGERNIKFSNVYKIILALDYSLEKFFKGL